MYCCDEYVDKVMALILDIQKGRIHPIQFAREMDGLIAECEGVRCHECGMLLSGYNQVISHFLSLVDESNIDRLKTQFLIDASTQDLERIKRALDERNYRISLHFKTGGPESVHCFEPILSVQVPVNTIGLN